MEERTVLVGLILGVFVAAFVAIAFLVYKLRILHKYIYKVRIFQVNFVWKILIYTIEPKFINYIQPISDVSRSHDI